MSRIFALAVFAAALTSGARAQAFEVKHTDAGALVSWHRSNVTWTIDRSIREVHGGEAAAVAAVDAWTQRAGGPTLTVGKTGARLEPGFDGINGIFYARDGYAPAGDALAVTLLRFDEDTGEVIEADIVVNGKYQFAPITKDGAPLVAPQSVTEGTYDIGRVLAHEMGHALALSDEPAQESALMFPYVPRARALATSPGKDDLAGLTALYVTGAKTTEAPVVAATPSGCSAARLASDDDRHAPASAWLAVASLFCAAVVARRASREKLGSDGE